MTASHPLSYLIIAACLTWVAPATAAALPPCAFWDGDELHLRGQVGADDVSLYLVAGWPSLEEDGVSGLALDQQKWERRQDATTPVGGVLLTECRVRLTESTGEHARWELRIVSGRRVEGTRTAGDRPQPVSFRIGSPFDCAAGRWKRFAKPDWPITFEYPASSRFSVAGSQARVECPDASRLAWGSGSITLEHVWRIEARGADGRTGTRMGPFVRFGTDAWRVGEDEDCGQRPEDVSFLDCGHAAARPWHGFTVLQGPSPSYGSPSGGTTHYAFLLNDEAVVVSSRALPDDISSVDAAPTGDARSLAAAAARMVRSVKRAPAGRAR